MKEQAKAAVGQCRARLEADFPKLAVEKIEVLGKGWEHVALEVNDSIIFRVPRGIHDSGKLSQSVAYETAVLRLLQDKMPVAIPDPLYIAPGNAYFGYPKLPGVLLNDMEDDLNEADKQQVRHDWVDIAATIHGTIPIETAQELGVRIFKADIGRAPKIFDFSHISDDIKNFARKTIKDVEATDLESQRLYVIHNDLHFLNLLASPETKRITGVIDWTDICIGPLEAEFSVWGWVSDDQLDKASQGYEQKTGIRINRQQAKMWRHIEGLKDYVVEFESGEEAEAQKSLGYLERWARDVRTIS